MMPASQPRPSDRVVVITGASSGFGLATARAFAREGDKLALAARNANRLQQAADELRKEHGDRVLAVTCDVSKRDEVDALVAKTIERFGRIDVLVNNAGSGLIAPFEATQVSDAAALFQANFFGALHCTQSVLPHMKRQRAGHIINVASIAGLRGVPNSSIYSASKAALITWAEALRIELHRDGIAVSTVCPGRATNTGFFDNAKYYGKVELYPSPIKLTADDVARAILHVALKPHPITVVPGPTRLWCFVNKLAPRLIDRFLLKHMPRTEQP